MARPRRITDAELLAAVRRCLMQHGPRETTLDRIARESGLAAPTIVQRFGSRDNLVARAHLDGWDALDRSLASATATAGEGPRGAVRLLKILDADCAELPTLLADAPAASRARARNWREMVEAALASRLEGPPKRRAEQAATLFAAWQGRQLWQARGGRGFRLLPLAETLAANG